MRMPFLFIIEKMNITEAEMNWKMKKIIKWRNDDPLSNYDLLQHEVFGN